MPDHPRTGAATSRSEDSTSAGGRPRGRVARALRPVLRRLRWAAALALVVPGLAATPAQAAMPNFQLPFTCGQSWNGDSDNSSAHTGYEIDFNRAGDEGQPVLAAAAGEVHVNSYASGYGYYLILKHGTTGYYTLYAHLQSQPTVQGNVRQGQLIGRVGATGNVSGAHLHYEQKYGGISQAHIVPAVFNGSTFGYPNQTLVSRNCGGGSEDFSGDGIDDLVGAHSVDGDLYLFRGTGGSTPGVHSGVSMADAWTGMRLISSGDFTGDGNADVVAVSGVTADLYLYVGNGSGGFSSSKVIGNNWSQIRMITMGDFTGDGRDDVVALHGGTGDLIGYPATGSGSTLSLGTAFPLGSGWTGMRLITSGDFNSDGWDDIVGVHSQTADLYMYAGANRALGNGGVIQSNWSQIKFISAIDFNGDGIDDIAAVNSANGNLYRYYGNGSGNIGGDTSVGTGWTNIRILGT